MKLAKRTLALVLAIALAVAVMVVPASAASSSMLARIDKFPYLYHGVSNSHGVKALQRFLLQDTNNAYRGDLLGDGMDGGFGPHVENAVRNYQIRHGIYGPNNNGTGEGYTQTWTAIANDVRESSGIITKNYVSVYKVTTSGKTYSFYYFDENTGDWSESSFVQG